MNHFRRTRFYRRSFKSESIYEYSIKFHACKYRYTPSLPVGACVLARAFLRSGRIESDGRRRKSGFRTAFERTTGRKLPRAANLHPQPRTTDRIRTPIRILPGPSVPPRPLAAPWRRAACRQPFPAVGDRLTQTAILGTNAADDGIVLNYRITFAVSAARQSRRRLSRKFGIRCTVTLQLTSCRSRPSVRSTNT